MEKVIRVIDDYLLTPDFYTLKASLLAPEFDWHFCPKIIEGPVLDLPEPTYQLVHIFYLDNAPYSDKLSILNPLFRRLPINSLVRIKANLNPQVFKQEPTGFHCDFDNMNSTTAIFYLNTNNGYTLFEDGSKIESVENRLVLFPTSFKHSGVGCTDSPYRLVVNINYF